MLGITKNSFHYSVRDASWIEHEIILSQLNKKEMEKLKTSTKFTIVYCLIMIIMVFGPVWYVSKYSSYDGCGIYEFTVITHNGLILKDTFEMDYLPKESLCRTVHYPVGLKPILINPIEHTDIYNWYDIVQKCSIQKTEYQFITKVEYYIATPRRLKR